MIKNHHVIYKKIKINIKKNKTTKKLKPDKKG